MEESLTVPLTQFVHEFIAAASISIELLGVLVIAVAATKLALSPSTLRNLLKGADGGSHSPHKRVFGSSLLMGMDFLVAGDVIKSVALELTLPSISALALLVLVRTFLSWSILVEIEGRWPWQRSDGYDGY